MIGERDIERQSRIATAESGLWEPGALELLLLDLHPPEPDTGHCECELDGRRDVVRHNWASFLISVYKVAQGEWGGGCAYRTLYRA